MIRTFPCISFVILLIVFSGGGCTHSGEYLSSARKENGLVMILPGIGGKSPISRDIGWGLNAAGVQCAIKIRQWGFAIPLAKLPVNQMNVVGNRAEAERIAQDIRSYQNRYPGRPVYLVGFSGGGGMAIFALELLEKYPDQKPVEGVLLLSASLSRDYNLTTALDQTKNGIVNFHNPRDVILLAVGTTLLGNVDGGRSPSAGRVGFIYPDTVAESLAQNSYERLYQVEITPEMIDRRMTPHVSATAVPFVATYVAEWIISETWPPKSPQISGTKNTTE